MTLEIGRFEEPSAGTLHRYADPAEEVIVERLIEAFRVDRRMERIKGPRGYGSGHPQMEYSDEEREDWEAIPLDVTRMRPLPEEIAAADEAFEWLRAVAAANPDAHSALKGWAMRAARDNKGGVSIRSLAKRHGVSAPAILKRKDKAVSIIIGIASSRKS